MFDAFCCRPSARSPGRVASGRFRYRGESKLVPAIECGSRSQKKTARQQARQAGDAECYQRRTRLHARDQQKNPQKWTIGSLIACDEGWWVKWHSGCGRGQTLQKRRSCPFCGVSGLRVQSWRPIAAGTVAAGAIGCESAKRRTEAKKLTRRQTQEGMMMRLGLKQEMCNCCCCSESGR